MDAAMVHVPGDRRGRSPTPSRASLPGLVALTVAGSVAAAFWARSIVETGFGYDLDAYLDAAERLRQGLPLYPLVGLAAVTPGPNEGYFFNSPLVALGFVPLAALPRSTAHLVWFAMLSALALVLVASFARGHERAARPWIVAAGIAYLPLLLEVPLGNLNLASVVLLAASWRLRERTVAGGTLLAAGVGLKLLPILVLVFLLVDGRWRLVAVATAVGALSVVATAPWLGGAWIDYAAVLSGVGAGVPAGTFNVVPAVLAGSPGRYVVPALALAVTLWAGWCTRRAVRRACAPGVESLGFWVALGVSPLLATTVWYTYLVFALPLLLTPLPAPAQPRARAPAARAAAYGLIEARFAPLPLAGLLVAVLLAALHLRPVTRPGDRE